MSVLKIKNGQNNWESIPTINGRTPVKGTDYWTNEDKDEIVDYVIDSGEVVGDVQINGTSIVDNGVANIPTASANSLGVAKVLSSNGITIQSNGALAINKAASSQIKDGTATYHPITPYTQHESTFYGLAKSAGDTTQSASSNAVGTYTKEAKQKINAMLETQFRTIKTINITEETGKIYVIADDNNNPFSLTEMVILFEGVATTVAGTIGIGVNMGNVFYKDDGAFIYCANLTASGAVRSSVVNIMVRGGRFFADAIINTPKSYTSGLSKISSKNAMGIIACNPITEFCIGQANDGKFTEGTITIYGR